MENGQGSDSAAVQADFDRLAEVLGGAEVRRSFREDPQKFLDEFDLGDLPQEAVETLAGLTGEELALFSRVHGKISDLRDLYEVGIVF